MFSISIYFAYVFRLIRPLITMLYFLPPADVDDDVAVV